MTGRLQTRDLGDLCEIVGGGTPSKAEASFYAGDIAWATVRDMRQDVITETEFKISKDAVRNSTTNIIPAGNVVIATRVGLGKVCMLGQDTAINQDLRGIVPRDDKTLSVKYLYWWLKSVSDLVVAEGKGATVQGVRLPFVKSLQIPVPSLAEQQRTVGLLDAAFHAINTATAKTERNLLNARSVFDSHLQAIFNSPDRRWAEWRLGDLFDIGSSKRILEADWAADGVPFYGGKEIVKLSKFGSVVSNAYISEKKFEDYASKYDMPRQGDILITARGTIGVGYVVRKGDRFYYKDGNIISMRQKVPTNAQFVLYAFKSNAIVDQLGDLTGTTVRHLPIEKAKKLVLKMPGFAVQSTIVKKFEELEGEIRCLASIYERKMIALEALKKSLLHQAFRGKM